MKKGYCWRSTNEWSLKSNLRWSSGLKLMFQICRLWLIETVFNTYACLCSLSGHLPEIKVWHRNNAKSVFFYRAWSTPWGHILSQKSFCQIPVLRNQVCHFLVYQISNFKSQDRNSTKTFLTQEMPSSQCTSSPVGKTQILDFNQFRFSL